MNGRYMILGYAIVALCYFVFAIVESSARRRPDSSAIMAKPMSRIFPICLQFWTSGFL